MGLLDHDNKGRDAQVNTFFEFFPFSQVNILIKVYIPGIFEFIPPHTRDSGIRYKSGPYRYPKLSPKFFPPWAAMLFVASFECISFSKSLKSWIFSRQISALFFHNRPTESIATSVSLDFVSCKVP